MNNTMAAAALRLTRLPRTLPAALPRPTLPAQIEHAAALAGTALTVRELYHFGERAHQHPERTRLHSAQFLHSELATRLAHRVRDLHELPHGLGSMPSVQRVREMYLQSFRDIAESPLPQDAADEKAFSDMLVKIRSRHDDVVKLMAKGVLELKESGARGTHQLELKDFLDGFYMSRIGVRVLISHHLALGTGGKGLAGIINRECNPAKLIEDAVEASRRLSYAHYGEAAPVEIRGNTDLTFPYIDAHMFLCLFELLKNSLRATVETHRDAAVLPPVRVIVADGKEDVTVKISDEGGGFRRSEMKGVWSYLFTTAKLPARQLLALEDRKDGSNRPDPIAGFGYGLPLSRLYARYWGGELALSSMEGYGTDAYLHLCKLGDKKECLGA